MPERPHHRPVRAGFMLTGFTLIELLVAISILAIVAVLGWRGLDGIVRARIALTANLDQTRAMQLTFAQMQSDCAKIDSTVVLGHAPLVADQTRLMMVRAVYAEDQPSRLQVVTYRVRNGNLTRRESLATRDLGELAGAWQAAAADSDAEQALVLQSPVAVSITPPLPPQAALRVVFGREPVDKPFVLTLASGESTVAINADGIGHFVVQ